MLAVLAGGALLLVSTLLPWATGSARSILGVATPVQVNGADGAAVVPSAALVILAAGLAIGLAGPVARIVAAVAVALCGALAAGSVVAFLTNPEAALRGPAAAVSGVSELVGPAQTTPWSIVAIVIAAALAVLGAVLPFRMGQWSRVGQRYERAEAGSAGAAGTASSPPAGGRGQHIADWDALSRGDDPSEADDR